MRVTTLLRRIGVVVLISCAATRVSAQTSAPIDRPRVGLALGGGSARGMAHVGVLRWLEEHRVPIDAIAGTSMGGLIGGAYATGMSPDEIETLLAATDWDAVFGASQFRFDHVRRKRDLREYTSRLEYGLKRGLAAPPALNGGQEAGLLLSRITAAYFQLKDFDALPTPFRCVATDIRTAESVVLRDGSLAQAMRATMSMPLIFPPVIVGARVLVDGGTLNQIPTDVALAMGARTVIAVNVGDLGARPSLDLSLLGTVVETMDAMIRANAAANLAAADVRISVPLNGYRPTDWHRVREVIRAGYDAAEAAKDQLLPLAIDDVQWAAWRDRRQKATITSLPVPDVVRVSAGRLADSSRIRRQLVGHQGHALDIDAVEQSINELGEMDRFERIGWELSSENGSHSLVFTSVPKINGPPFLFFGVSLENTTSNDFRFGVGARYVAFDVLGDSAELRLDGALGSEPAIGARWYRPIASTSFFAEPIVNAATTRISVIEDGRITAEYGRRRVFAGLDLGWNPGRLNELRVGGRLGNTHATVRLGDDGLPEFTGTEATIGAQWTYDGQDDPMLPSRGTYLRSNLSHALRAPVSSAPTDGRTSADVTKAEASLTWVRRLTRDGGRRLFVVGGAGTAFNGRPLLIDQFALGGPLRLTAYGIGEVRGDHFAHAGAGYLHRVLRLPDLLGRSVFVGGWVESGSAFDRAADADVSVQGSIGVIVDSVLGPIFGGTSIDATGRSRWYIGIGRIFR
jgi:NTE family protein